MAVAAPIHPPAPRAGLYARISHDDRHDELGVRRQQQDGEADLLRRGVSLHRAYVDDDLSGSGLVLRPQYEDLLEDLRSGAIQVVWAWDLDRLFRGLREFVEFVETCEAVKARVLWSGGAADFATGEGIMELEFKALLARAELRKLRGRVTRKMAELRERGKWHGGRAAYGYRQVAGPDGKVELVIEPAEAAVIREAATRLLAGETIGQIVTDLDARGVKTKNGARWRRKTLITILTSARISARVESEAGLRTTEDWEPILSPAESDRLRARFGARRGERSDRRARLLTGIVVCGKCGGHMLSATRSGRRRYQCRTAADGCYGCGSLAVTAEPLEEFVVAAVIRFIDSGQLSAILHADQAEDAQQAERDLAWASDELADLARRRIREHLTPEEVQAERTELLEQRRRAQSVLDAAQRSLHLPHLPSPLAAGWDGLQVHEQRVILRAVLQSVRIMPARHIGRGFDPSRVALEWRA